jgi:glutathione S-transferase
MVMSATPDLTLWGVGTSRTIRAHWAMHELGLAYKVRPIGPRTGETNTAEYTRLNPRQKIPLLQDGDFCIGESAAIVAYLSRTYSTPDRSLIPETQREYAAWLEWCFFIVAELDSTSLYVMRRHRADALGHIYGVAPEVVAQAG